MVVDGGGWWMVVDGRKKSSRILLKICSDEVQGILMCGNLENLRKTFFIGKKIQLQLSKSGGILVEKKSSLISLKVLSDEAQVI